MGGDTVQVRMWMQEPAKENLVQVNMHRDLPNTLFPKSNICWYHDTNQLYMYVFCIF